MVGFGQHGRILSAFGLRGHLDLGNPALPCAQAAAGGRAGGIVGLGATAHVTTP